MKCWSKPPYKGCSRRLHAAESSAWIKSDLVKLHPFKAPYSLLKAPSKEPYNPFKAPSRMLRSQVSFCTRGASKLHGGASDTVHPRENFIILFLQDMLVPNNILQHKVSINNSMNMIKNIMTVSGLSGSHFGFPSGNPRSTRRLLFPLRGARPHLLHSGDLPVASAILQIDWTFAQHSTLPDFLLDIRFPASPVFHLVRDTRTFHLGLPLPRTFA